MSNNVGKFTKTFFFVVAVLTLSIIAGNLYTFYLKKDYQVTVEVPCDLGQLCFVRDCSGDECPPNELEQYQMFTLSASDFDRCSGDSCESFCKAGMNRCEEMVCDEEAGDVCSINSDPEITQE